VRYVKTLDASTEDCPGGFIENSRYLWRRIFRAGWVQSCKGKGSAGWPVVVQLHSSNAIDPQGRHKPSKSQGAHPST